MMVDGRHYEICLRCPRVTHYRLLVCPKCGHRVPKDLTGSGRPVPALPIGPHLVPIP